MTQSFAFVFICMLLSFDHQNCAYASPTFYVFALSASTIDLRIREVDRGVITKATEIGSVHRFDSHVLHD